MLNVDKNVSAKGFIKIVQTDPATGLSYTLVEKPNTILYSGADLLAYAIAGKQNAKISHMYVSYKNSGSTSPTDLPTIDLADSNSITNYSAPLGYVRLPLAFNPSFQASDSNYKNNIPVFCVTVGSPNTQGGAPIATGNSWLFEIALVAALDPNNPTNDVVFSRAQFTPVQYNSSYALTLLWGVEFKAN